MKNFESSFFVKSLCLLKWKEKNRPTCIRGISCCSSFCRCSLNVPVALVVNPYILAVVQIERDKNKATDKICLAIVATNLGRPKCDGPALAIISHDWDAAPCGVAWEMPTRIPGFSETL